ncbi:potassium-transporting ATPase subunit A [Fructobacillus pseudoficulneus]|uniref:Potassium-transporting ATPase subunit A n=1 Tax=Fructobacillus pseudoficulneus TaxID=220714 RepID=A0A3F3GXF4_9LACO|nr:DUF5906 domain-containing protein [Fructobacillus pseudoficulneus]GAP03374.1 potassium-transporting ATPase subunit A [Fructobacillus pseudoficulneus]SEH43674.1 D5 N terminal like [Fructobacillus pseudoficulneus]
MTEKEQLEQVFADTVAQKVDWVQYNQDGKAVGVKYVELADLIIKEHPFLAVPFGDELTYYSYNGVNWDKVTKTRAKEQAERYAFDYLKSADVYRPRRMQDVAKTVLVNGQRDHNPFTDQKTDRVAFKNGTYMFDSGERMPNSPKDYLINGHQIEAQPGKASPNINAWGSYLFGPSWQYVKEVLGYAFIPEQTTFNTITILLDETGGSGKSYFVEKIVRPLIGQNNITAKDIDTLTGSNGKSNRFGTFDLINKLANIHLDIPDTRIDMPDTLKTLSGGDVVEVEGKGTNSVSVKLYALLIFASNNKPKIAVSSALLQRMHLVPVVAPKVRDNPQEANMRAHLWDEGEAVKELGGFAIECIETFKQAKAQGHLTVNDEIEKVTKDWATGQDLVATFLLEAQKETPEGYTGGISKQVAFARFRDWLSDNHIESKMNKKSFGTSLTQKGILETRTRLHPDGDTGNAVASWQGLDLEKYT